MLDIFYYTLIIISTLASAIITYFAYIMLFERIKSLKVDVNLNYQRLIEITQKLMDIEAKVDDLNGIKKTKPVKVIQPKSIGVKQVPLTNFKPLKSFIKSLNSSKKKANKKTKKSK